MNKTKILTLFGVFAFLFLSLSLVSAAVFEAEQIFQPTDIAHDANSFSVLFNVTYSGSSDSVDVTFDTSSLTSGDGEIVISDVTVLKDQTLELSATINFEAHQSGNIAGTIVAEPSAGSSVNVPFSVKV